jgi:hypothetical protein
MSEASARGRAFRRPMTVAACDAKAIITINPTIAVKILSQI